MQSDSETAKSHVDAGYYELKRRLSWARLSTLLDVVSVMIIALFTTVLSSFITKAPNTDVIPIYGRLLFFIVGLFVLEVIVVSVRALVRRENRDVIILKHRLGQIYLSAVRQSALNPRFESSASHE